MAKADTFSMEDGGYQYVKEGCIICGAPAVARGFFYPTYMNGDAKWLGDYCKEHKGTSLSAVAHGKIEVRYALPDYPNAPITSN